MGKIRPQAFHAWTPLRVDDSLLYVLSSLEVRRMNLIRGSSLQSLDNKAGFCKKAVFTTLHSCSVWRARKTKIVTKEDFYFYFFSNLFICRPSDSTVSEDAGIEPRTVATSDWLSDKDNNALWFPGFGSITIWLIRVFFRFLKSIGWKVFL